MTEQTNEGRAADAMVALHALAETQGMTVDGDGTGKRAGRVQNTGGLE